MVRTTSKRGITPPSLVDHAGDDAILDDQILGGGGDDVQVRIGEQLGLHGLGDRARGRSAERGPRTAGPFERFSRQDTGCRPRRRSGPSGRPGRRPRGPDGPCPGRRWPGCSDISPTVSRLWVSSRVRAPALADAAAASQPACPPPMTMTSQVLEHACAPQCERPHPETVSRRGRISLIREDSPQRRVVVPVFYVKHVRRHL